MAIITILIAFSQMQICVDIKKYPFLYICDQRPKWPLDD